MLVCWMASPCQCTPCPHGRASLALGVKAEFQLWPSQCWRHNSKPSICHLTSLSLIFIQIISGPAPQEDLPLLDRVLIFSQNLFCLVVICVVLVIKYFNIHPWKHDIYEPCLYLTSDPFFLLCHSLYDPEYTSHNKYRFSSTMKYVLQALFWAQEHQRGHPRALGDHWSLVPDPTNAYSPREEQMLDISEETLIQMPGALRHQESWLWIRDII